jgi:hypothetical protein
MKSYRICITRIVYEVLNTEVIAIDFQTGNYYAIIHIAKQIWQLIEQHLPLDQIASVISAEYPIDPAKVSSDLNHFIGELLDEGLIEECTVSEFGNPIPFDTEGWEYDVPRLQRYTDVQNLLLLDPIHEVTDAGWPEKLES